MNEKIWNKAFVCSWNELESFSNAKLNKAYIRFVKGGIEKFTDHVPGTYIVLVHPSNVPILPIANEEFKLNGKIIDISDFDGDSHVLFENFVISCMESPDKQKNRTMGL